MQQQWTISWWHCDMWWEVNFIWHLMTTSSVAGLRRSSKALPKAKHAPIKGHGHCLVVCCWSDLLQLSEPRKTITSKKSARQVDEICQKLQWLQLALVNRKGPVLLHNNVWHIHRTINVSKVVWIGLQSFALSTIFTWPLYQPSTTSSSISTTFCRENAITTSKKQKMLSKSSLNPEAWMFILQE